MRPKPRRKALAAAGLVAATSRAWPCRVTRISSSRPWYWDDAANGWVVPAGPFTVYAGDSSALASLPLRGHLTITKTIR